MRFKYKCNVCDKIAEIDFTIKEPKPKEIDCPIPPCLGRAHRVYESPAIKFKGKGFYTNDQWTMTDMYQDEEDAYENSQKQNNSP